MARKKRTKALYGLDSVGKEHLKEAKIKFQSAIDIAKHSTEKSKENDCRDALFYLFLSQKDIGRAHAHLESAGTSSKLSTDVGSDAAEQEIALAEAFFESMCMIRR